MRFATAITIEPVRESDIEGILRIQTENNLGRWQLQDYLAEIRRENSRSFVAKEDGELTGFVVSRLITSEDYTHKNYSHSELEIEIYNLAVEKNQRKKGIGTLLLRKIAQTETTKDKMTIWLEVRESNLAAISFYKKNKFEEIYRRKKFYNNPQEDALVMRSDFLKK